MGHEIRSGIESGQAAPSAPALMPFVFEEFEASGPAIGLTVSPHSGSELDLKIELGRAQLRPEDVVDARQGTLIPLDKRAGEPVEIVIAGCAIARGELLVLDDRFCVRVSELIETVP